MRAAKERGRVRRMHLDLRLRLLLFDIAALTVAALVCVAFIRDAARGTADSVLFILGAIVSGMVFARWQRLYQSSRNSMRSVEITAIVRVAVLMGAASALLDEFSGTGPHATRALALAAATALFLTVGRSLFRAWLRARRSAGDFLRPVVVVGADGDSVRIVRVIHDHQDLGFEVVGVCSDLEDAQAARLQRLWRGNVDSAVDLVRDGSVTGAIVVASALDRDTLNRIVREITTAGGHVHLSSGLQGLASQRIASESIAHEPLLHIQPWRLDSRQAITKRTLDIVLSSALLVLSGPIVLAAMAVIKVTTPGPAFFRQARVGRDNCTFDLLKLRTMQVDAEDRLDELLEKNVREGPLFKVDHDPRVTSFGRFLRATSIDELPQLWNVLWGDMSLVGPRPALPSEVKRFPAELSKRTNVLPGITGLWQVEARDNPSFDAYARLDLFYIENWTVTLDLVILFATIESETFRLLSVLLRRPGKTPLPNELRTPPAAETAIDVVTDAAYAESVHPQSALID